jgi:membrane-associated phospholipid phosphatase
MTTLGQNPNIDRVAKITSVVFHPGFQQYYLLLYFLIVGHEPWPLHIIAVVFLLVIPTTFYVWYKKKILREDNIYMMHRKDRFWPILVNFGGLLCTSIALSLWSNTSINTLANDFLDGLPISATALLAVVIVLVLNILANAITFAYKISLHMLATASSTFIFWYLSGPWLWLIVWVVFVLLVGWSRLHLRGHTFDQVFWGTLVGTMYAFAILAVLTV